MAFVVGRRSARTAYVAGLVWVAGLGFGSGRLLRPWLGEPDPATFPAAVVHSDRVASSWLASLIRNNDLDGLASACQATRFQAYGRAACQVRLWITPPSPRASE